MPQSKASSAYGWSRQSSRRAGAWWNEPARPAPFLELPRRSELGAWSTVAIVLGLLGVASVVMARSPSEPQKLSAMAGGADQHTCHALVGKTVLATNQIDFNLRAAQALQYGCLEFRDGSLTVHHDALFGHITQVVKVGIDQK